jgi:hypothetical protein
MLKELRDKLNVRTPETAPANNRRKETKKDQTMTIPNTGAYDALKRQGGGPSHEFGKP